MHKHTLAELSQALAQKKVSSMELTQYYLNRIKQFNGTLNCFITLCEEKALAQAQQADQLIAQGNHSHLMGIPMAHKDIFCTEGVLTTCSSKMLSNFIPPYNATIVDQLNQAGMVNLGKLNMDEFAMGASNETSFYGPVLNPWDTQRVPGGSSGGSSAAVAARLIPFATASDTGGSIRQPATLCNLTGLKPTYGRVSRYGMIAFASSLDQAGPLTLTAEDAAMVMNAMAGFDEKDSTSINHPIPDYTKTLNNDIAGMTIGLPEEFFNDELDPKITHILEQSIDTLKQLGVNFQSISLPNVKHSVSIYYILAPAECSSNLARFDGVRYGYRCDNPKNLEDLYRRSRTEALGEEVKRRILTGTYVLSAGYYDAFYVKAQKARQLIREDYQKAFETVDMILSPCSPTTAFKIGEKSKDPVSMYQLDMYTISTNMAGLPGLALQGGFIDELPIGFQLTGQYFDEARLLNVGHQYQQTTDWHKRIPNDFE